MSELELIWHRVADLDELRSGHIKTVTAGVHAVAPTNNDGDYTAMDNRCPYQRSPLGEGSMRSTSGTIHIHSAVISSARCSVC